MIKRLFCKHDYGFVRNIYGDEIIQSGFKRSIWKCRNCGKAKYSEHLYSSDLEVEKVQDKL